MAYVTGPNGLVTEVPEAVASALIGNGERGYAAAPGPVVTKKPVRKRTTKPAKQGS